jgi:uncharacterized surface protein with fasciclin (FAS1) repeats
MKRVLSLTLGFLTLLLLVCCSEDKIDLYERPPWLTGKIYSQIKERPELSLFAECISRTELEKILDASGSYTVFAPENDAVNTFLQSKGYNSPADIPQDQLERMVRFHILQNVWSKQQLQSLDIYGWVDPHDPNNNKPRGFKRQTLLRDNDINLGVKYSKELKRFVIANSSKSQLKRRVINDIRKHAPIFYQEYFRMYNLAPADFRFYFSRPLDRQEDIFMAGGKIISNEVFAENGVIYIIDKVVDPLKSAFQILSDENGQESYKDFLGLIFDFPVFQYNHDKTIRQPESGLGFDVDSLFDLTFPQLAFNVCNEQTRLTGVIGLPADVTIRYHHGLVAPTDQALRRFEQDYLAGPDRWGSFQSAPEHIKRIFINTHMSVNSIYPSDFSRGFFNGESDIEYLDSLTIVQRQFASNSTFIGVSECIVPRAFKSVTGPVYLQPGYSTYMNAIETTRLLAPLKRSDENYQLFIVHNNQLLIDSSLIFNPVLNSFSSYILSPGGTDLATRVSLSTADVRTLLLNHITVEKPAGIAKMEFTRTMAGNHLIYNNITGEVRGTASTTAGFMGSETVHEVPERIPFDPDNGQTYRINNWFSFSIASVYSRISTLSPAFHKLLLDAGLANDKEYRYTFISENDVYTIFVPTDEAIARIDTQGFTNKQLRDFLLLHFVKGELIFTDGRIKPGYFETERTDERSTPFLKINSKIYIDPGIDLITIRNKNGGNYLTIPESSSSNIFAAQLFGGLDLPYRNTRTKAVIHQINTVLAIDELDRN